MPFVKGVCPNPKGRPKGTLGPHKIKINSYKPADEVWTRKKLEGTKLKPTRKLWNILDSMKCSPALELTKFAMDKVVDKRGEPLEIDPKLRLKAIELLFRSTYAQLKSLEVKGDFEPRLFFNADFGKKKDDE